MCVCLIFVVFFLFWVNNVVWRLVMALLLLSLQPCMRVSSAKSKLTGNRFSIVVYHIHQILVVSV